MRLGIDFGTTRSVVALADRGNYPVLSFQSDTGDTIQYYPTLIAAREGEWAFGLDALVHRNEPGWFFLRSLKRLLADAGPESQTPLGDRSEPVISVMEGFLSGLKQTLRTNSSLDLSPEEPLEVLIAVPANANSNQRFLTFEGFRRAGFSVLGMINEPSAAGLEYAHSQRPRSDTARQEHLVVYDLGGGTFDTSIVCLRERTHEVLTNEGISRLGGDDFDELLLELALSRAGIESLSGRQRYQLLDVCREQKEMLHPNTRKIVLDLGRVIEGADEAVIPVTEFYDRCQPLVERTIAAVESAISHAGGGSEIDWKDLAAVYLVGGSSDLPIVSRMLRERYGRRVRRSHYPFAATAIGLAIAADAAAGFELKERFTRHFGVWRETDGGSKITFDTIFRKDTKLPATGEPPLVLRRTYRPAHNIGHYRYVECGRLMEEGEPAGDITPWNEIFFPFDPELRNLSQLSREQVRRTDRLRHQEIEEEYSCTASGLIEVTIAEKTSGFKRTFRLR